MDLWGISRKKAVIINLLGITILSVPCALGFNVLSAIEPLGPGTNIMDLEDFLVSNNLLPIGSLVYLLFCVSKNGWGFDNFLNEANAGEGIKFPKVFRIYMTYILPLIVVGIYLKGYWDYFSDKGWQYLVVWMGVAVAILFFVSWIVFSKKKEKN